MEASAINGEEHTAVINTRVVAVKLRLADVRGFFAPTAMVFLVRGPSRADSARL